MSDCGGNQGLYAPPPPSHELQVAQKYGGLAPKKKPLIAKDHERAFFDSADWALCKQGSGISTQTTTVAIETLQPKLQRTPHQQLPPRRPACTSTTTTTHVHGESF
ncbi:hypothetical protein LINPERHAP1_LOCUS24754 [Linum perenne]